MKLKLFPLGAIAGDVIGSVHEHAGTKTTDFPLFTPQSRITDDSVLTVAVAEVLATGGSYRDSIQRWAQAYPHAGYGGAFRKWMWSAAAEPCGSYGNGSGMRASPVGWARTSLEDVLAEARRSAEVTHDHPEGIKGAQGRATIRTCQPESKPVQPRGGGSPCATTCLEPLEPLRPRRCWMLIRLENAPESSPTSSANLGGALALADGSLQPLPDRSRHARYRDEVQGLGDGPPVFFRDQDGAVALRASLT